MEQKFRLVEKSQNLVNDLVIEVNENEYHCNKSISTQFSSVIKEQLVKNHSNYLKLDFADDLNHFFLISDLFNAKEILLNKENIQFLIEISEFLNIIELKKISFEFQNYLNEIEKLIKDDEGIHELIQIEQDIFNLTEENMLLLMKDLVEFPDKKLISQIIINACISKPYSIQLYMDLIKQFENREFNLIFLNTMLRPYIEQVEESGMYIEPLNEVNFILRCLIDMELVAFEDIPKELKFYSFYLFDFFSERYRGIMESIYQDQYPSFFNNLDQLKADNWNLHKKFVQNGENSDAIATVIRNDDINAFRLFASNPNFDLNSTIERSPYERCSFVSELPYLIEYAAFYGAINIFKYLFLNGAILSTRIAQFVVASGNLEMIRIIEQKGCNFDNTLEIAFNFARQNIFDWIILNKMNNSSQMPISEILNQCVHKNRFSIMVDLLENGWNPNDADIVTAAVQEDNLILLKLLLKIKGIVINRGDVNMDPPLVIACKHHNKEIVLSLLNHPNVDPNIRGENYRGPLSIVSANNDLEIAKILLARDDVYVNLLEEKRLSPFYNACANNNLEMVKLLSQQKGVDINSHTREDEKLTPLHIAALNNFTEVVRYLLSLEGIAINAQTKDGKTPLHMACQRENSLEIVKMLLNYKGINPNIESLEVYILILKSSRRFIVLVEKIH